MMQFSPPIKHQIHSPSPIICPKDYKKDDDTRGGGALISLDQLPRTTCVSSPVPPPDAVSCSQSMSLQPSDTQDPEDVP